jgi:hypothetical protein
MILDSTCTRPMIEALSNHCEIPSGFKALQGISQVTARTTLIP